MNNNSELLKLIAWLCSNKEFVAQLKEISKIPCTLKGLKISTKAEDREFNFELDELTTGVKQDE